MSKRSLVQRELIRRLLEAGATLGPGVAQLGAGGTLRLLRRRLQMTQAQLARRAGMSQSYIARIESGAVQPGAEVLTRVFEALGCLPALVPIPIEPLDQVVDRRARRLAESRVRYMAGTMALEEQRPDLATLEELIEEEAERIKRTGSTAIWEDDNE